MKILKKTLAVVLVMLSLFSTCTVAMPVFAENEDVSVAENEENIQPEIISEITEKREENVKHFMLSDGSFVVAQYNNPVHYQNDNGEWVDIDNTITKTDATTEQIELFGTEELYSTNNAVDNVVFAEKSNSNTLVAYEAKDYPISLNYQSAKKSNIKITENNEELTGNDAFLTLPNVTQEVIYENVFTDVDLQYIVSPTGLKENIILKSKNAQNSFTVNYNIGELTAEVIDEHTINLMADNEIVYTISAPYMYDANGFESKAVSLKVEKNKNGKLRVVVSADTEWLNEEQRTYPVVIDPSITEENHNSIYGVSVTDNSASTDTLSLSYGGSYALLDVGTVTSNAFIDHVVSAEVHLPIISNSSSTATRIYLRKVTENWRGENNTVANVNPSVASVVADYENVETTASKLNFDITKLYMDWEKGDANYGVKLEMVKDGNLTFAASSETDPVLTVNYMSTIGLDMTMPMTTFDMGSAGSVYVNNYSGNLVITRENEISTTGEEYPYDLSVTYNSFVTDSAANAKWLPGYSSGFTDWYAYMGSDGKPKYFSAYKSADGTQKAIEMNLVKNTTNLYELTANDFGWEHLSITSDNNAVLFDAWKNNTTEKHSFDTDGIQKIVTAENLNTNYATVSTIFSREAIADSTDFYIVDGDGQKLFVQNTESSYTVTQYSCVSDSNYSAGERVTYVYDTDGNVIQIKRGDKVEATFTYTDGRIETITDNNTHKLTFAYDGNSKRISKVTESKNNENGQIFSFERSINNVTTRTAGANGIYGDDDDRLTTSRFSPDLKLLGESYSTASGEYLGAVSYDRNDGTDVESSANVTSVSDDIKRVGVVGKTPNNLLKNHNIESETNWTKKAIADSNATYTAAVSDEKSYVGLNSFKVVTTDFTKGGAAGYCQTITPDMGLLQAGETYVASAYINASSFTKDEDALSMTSYGGFVMVEIKTSSGTDRRYSNPITNTCDNWERAFLTFVVPEDFTEITVALIARNGAGTAYFDAVQVEEGDYPGQYNMLENNSFNFVNSSNRADKWTRYDLSTSDAVENGEMKMTGSPDKNKAVFQDVGLSGASQSDTYTLSCWAVADSMPEKLKTVNPYWRHYSIRVKVYYTDEQGNSVDRVAQVSEFNHFDGEEQFISGSFNLEHPSNSELTPYKIRVLLAYYRQCNTAFFDDVALFRSAEVYDLTEEVTEESDAPTVTCEHYTNGNIKTKTVTDNGNVTVYSYAENGEMTSEAYTETNTDESGNISTITTTYTYNSDGSIATYTDEDGILHTYTYNSNGNVVSILKPDGTGDTFEYELYNTDKTRIKKEIYDDGTVYDYTYHSGDIVATETVTTENDDETTTVEVYNYDTHGNLVSYTVDNILKESYTYTEIGDEYLVATETADGYVTAYTYNADGETTQRVKTLNGAEVEKDLYEYHSDDKYLTKQSHTENGATLTTHYNSDGDVTKVVHNGFEYNYVYDNFGNTTNVKVGSQSIITYEYSQDKSNLRKITYGNGDTEEYTYNAYGQPLKKTVSSLGNVSYRYDNAGNLTYQKDELSDRRTYFDYDLKGNFIGQKIYIDSIVNVNECFLFSSANVYDDKDRVTRKDMQGEHYALDTYYYYDDETDLISSVATTIGGSRRINYTYDDDDRVVTKSMTTTTPYVNSYTYNDDGLIATDTVTAKNGTFAYGYTYDDNGNITEITKNGTVQQRYIYDETDQLVREDNLDINKSIVYEYDNYGNILNKKEYAFTTGELGTATDTITYTYNDTGWKDQLTSYDGQSISYDAIGNPTTYRGITMAWNGRKLMSYAKDGTSITYKYDGNGLRTSKTVNGVKHDYYYDENNQLIYEIKEGVYELYYKYDADGNLFSITRYRYSDGEKHVFYATTNTRGDVIELRSANGAIYATYTYDSWGKCISVKNSSGAACSVNTVAVQNSIRYRGYVYDYETGLYYLQSRYYDPEVGRFLNADAVDMISKSKIYSNINLYSYCNNLPVNYIDNFGEKATIIVGKCISVTVAAIVFEDYLDGIEIKLDSEYNKKRKEKVKDTKGAIVINLETGLSEFIYNNFRTNKERKDAIKLLTIFCREKFYSEFAKLYNSKHKKSKKNKQKNREFLFSEVCVEKEIHDHIKGYLWATNDKKYKINLPEYMKAWALKRNGIKAWSTSNNKAAVKEATKEIGIAEADVYGGYGIDTQAFWYDYFGGISDAYKNGKSDPYYTKKGRSKNPGKQMEKWIGAMLPCEK